MNDPKIGAQIAPKEPVKQVASEGPLDQTFGVAIDDSLENLVLLESVLGPEDLMARCPVLGSITTRSGAGKKGVAELLKGDEFVMRDIYVNTPGEGLRPISEVSSEAFGVADASWLEDPKELVWRSGMLSQMQAKYNAISHFLNDPGIRDVGRGLDGTQRDAVVQRARELSARLKDEALAEINSGEVDARERLHGSVEDTRARLQKYVIKTEAETKAGGLTQQEVDSLFAQGGK